MALQGLLHRLRIEQRERRQAMGAGMLAPDVDRRAAAGAVDGGHAPRQVLDLGPGHLAHEALLDHEGREAREAAVALRAAVGHVAAAAHHVEALAQRAPAMRAGQRCVQRAMGVVAVLVEQLEQFQHGGRRQARAFLRVEPQALAGEADVQLGRHAGVGGEAAHLHGLAAGRAGGCAGHRPMLRAFQRDGWPGRPCRGSGSRAASTCSRSQRWAGSRCTRSCHSIAIS